MKHLYQKIYLTIIASLVLVVVVTGAIWRLDRGDSHNEPTLQIIGELVAIALPKPVVGQTDQKTAVMQLAQRLNIDLALYDENRTLVAATTKELPEPSLSRKKRIFGYGKPVWSFQLPDKRWIVAGITNPQHGSAAGLAGFLGGVALIIALCAYPVVRGLTRRLERLQTGVETLGTGDLAARVEVQGKDEIAQLAKSFNAAAQQIENLFASHRQLLANASHELRTPLARIRLGIELLKKETSSERQIELERDIAELDQLIDEILLASRLDVIQKLQTSEEIDLLALSAEECARYDSCWLHGEPVYVTGDPRLLRRLIRNLLENAAHHGKPPVEVEVKPNNGSVALNVSDHGSGIPESEWENVFAPFYRLPGSQNKSGSGLGLPLVRQIATRHGGSAVIARKPDGQTCISVTLPSV